MASVPETEVLLLRNTLHSQAFQSPWFRFERGHRGAAAPALEPHFLSRPAPGLSWYMHSPYCRGAIRVVTRWSCFKPVTVIRWRPELTPEGSERGRVPHMPAWTGNALPRWFTLRYSEAEFKGLTYAVVQPRLLSGCSNSAEIAIWAALPASKCLEVRQCRNPAHIPPKLMPPERSPV